MQAFNVGSGLETWCVSVNFATNKYKKALVLLFCFQSHHKPIGAKDRLWVLYAPIVIRTLYANY